MSKLLVFTALLLIRASAQDTADFRITAVAIAAGGETVAIKFNSEVGMTYRVEVSPSLGAGTWADIGISAEGDGGEYTLDVPTAGLGGTHYFRVSSAMAAPTGFVLIPAGTFQMGDALNDHPERAGEQPVHPVDVSAFFMQAKETTKAEWDEVHTWALANGYAFDNTGGGKAADHPVQMVNWYDVVKWCNAKSQIEGLTPCYYTDAAQTRVYKTGVVNVANTMVKWSADGYRLPTEAEWEKAARGGLEGRRFPWEGDQITHSLANYYSGDPVHHYDASPTREYHPFYNKVDPYTSPVGSFAPNDYGLYDMAGNVKEWCWDKFSSSYYSSSPMSDPRGPDSGSFRVERGGSWITNASACRASNRDYFQRTTGASEFNGFRIARSAVGGGNPPDLNPAPVRYVLTWLPGDGNSSTVYDVDANGIAVGNMTPGGIFQNRYGIVSFPDRSQLIDLQALASAHYPAGWRLTVAFTISDDLLISGDLYDPSGERHCFATQLEDNGPSLDPSILWFRVFSASDVGGRPIDGAVVYDASEQGDLTILTIDANPEGGWSSHGNVWRPAAGDPSPASVVGPTTFGAINNQRDILWGGALGPVVINADTGDEIQLGNYKGWLTNANDIGESGVVVGRWADGIGEDQSTYQAIRTIGGNWEPIAGAGTSSEAVKVNAADQILGFSNSRLFLFSDDPAIGFRLIDDLLDPTANAAADLAAWGSAAPLETANDWLYSISDPDESGFGHICGRRKIDGVNRGFVLTPISQ